PVADERCDQDLPRPHHLLACCHGKLLHLRSGYAASPRQWIVTSPPSFCCTMGKPDTHCQNCSAPIHISGECSPHRTVKLPRSRVSGWRSTSLASHVRTLLLWGPTFLSWPLLFTIGWNVYATLTFMACLRFCLV